MLNHPQNAQSSIDQRWHDLQVDVERERLAQTAQPPAATMPAWLLCPRSQLAFLRFSLGGWRPGFTHKTDLHWRTAS